MFTSENFTKSEQISLAQEIAVIGVESTPLTSLLMSKGKIEKALSTVYTWREKTLDTTEDISAEEGADTTEFYSSARAELSNVLEIFKKGAELSGTAQAMNSTQLSAEVQDRLIELKINIENKLINGIKADGSQAPYKRQLSGLIEMADSSNDVTANAVTEDTIKQSMRKLWNQNLAGGQFYALINADLKDQVDEIYKDKYGYADVTTEFGLIVNAVRTNYGTVNFVLSKNVPADKIVTFNDAYIDLVYLREPAFEPLAKTGDSVKGHVIAEATLKAGTKKAISVTTVEEVGGQAAKASTKK